jgi:hypothetical protein
MSALLRLGFLAPMGRGAERYEAERGQSLTRMIAKLCDGVA